METTSETNREELGTQAKTERRRGKRVPLVFPIEVSGSTSDGRTFSEKTKTLDISERGCRFVAEREMHRSEDIAIKPLGCTDPRSLGGKPPLFRVMWCTRTGARWLVGAMKLQPANIWPVAFPPVKLPGNPSV